MNRTILSSGAAAPWGVIAFSLTVALFASCSADDKSANSSPEGGGAADGSGGNPELLTDAGRYTTLDEAGREVVCDPVTGICTCINIGMLGRLPTYGAVPGQDNTAALQVWLNENSSADVQVHTSYVPLTPEFLAQYDVLILQALEDREGGPYWSYTADDIANLEAWVRAGGGVISMTGYGGQSAEVNPTNTLLAFTGMSYNTDDILGSTSDDCAYCYGSSVFLTGWNADHIISTHITAVGAFHGRSVNGGTPVAQSGSLVYGATAEIDAGRVFMFCDEWVSYTSQWDGSGLDNDCRTYDTNHSCYDAHPANDYQVAQFWYNSILWAANFPECFTVEGTIELPH